MKSYRSQNYYEILGVHQNATLEEIRNAYELSRYTFQENSVATYSLFNEDENQEILSMISRAYNTLFNPNLRQEYDNFLENVGSGTMKSSKKATPVKARRKPSAPLNKPLELRQTPHPPPPPVEKSSSPPRYDSPPSRTSKEENVGNGSGEEAQPGPKSSDVAAEKFIQSISVFNGAALKKVRHLRGFSVEDIAERTKIRKSYIEYLEEEQFTFLPAEVYVKGFISMIAGMLDLPVQRVVDDFMRSYHRGDSTG